MLENFLDSDLSSELEKVFGEGDKPFVWGFSFNRGIDGKPRVEKFGNFSYNKSPAAQDEQIGIREPLTDVIEETEQIRVISELPGVEKGDLDLRTTESKMVLKAKGESKRIYKKELKFPSLIIPESSKAKFRNGVLEIVFEKKNDSNESKKIPIS